MIRSKNLTLRILESRDIETLRIWRNDPEISQFFADAAPISEPEQKIWFERVSTNPCAYYMIVEKDDKFIGVANVKDIRWIHRTGSYGIYCLPSASNQMIPVEAAILFLDWCFDCLNLRKIHGDILDSNTRSQRFHKGLGFQDEGILRKQVFHQGEYHDLVAVGVFRDEYMKATSKYRKVLFGNASKQG